MIEQSIAVMNERMAKYNHLFFTNPKYDKYKITYSLVVDTIMFMRKECGMFYIYDTTHMQQYYTFGCMSELLEVTKNLSWEDWKTEKPIHPHTFNLELADVMIFLLQLCSVANRNSDPGYEYEHDHIDSPEYKQDSAKVLECINILGSGVISDWGFCTNEIDKLISNLTDIGGITYQQLLEYTYVKTMFVMMRFNEGRYLPCWHKETQDGIIESDAIPVFKINKECESIIDFNNLILKSAKLFVY